VKRLEEYHINVCVHDPWANAEEVMHEYGVDCVDGESINTKFDAIILAVAHKQFLTVDIKKLSKQLAVVYDVKAILNKSFIDSRL